VTRSVRLLCAVALSALWASEGHAQVSVPLPNPRQEPPAPPPAQEVRPPQSAAPAAPDGSPADQPQTSVPLPTVGQQRVPIGRHGRPDINPYERDIDMTVPLTFRNRNLGDIPVRLTYDDRLLVETETFLRLIRPLLNPPAQESIAGQLGTLTTFSVEDLAATGVSLEYDPGSLSVVVLLIDPSQRAVEQLFSPPADDRDDVALEPAGFSGYLNVNVVGSYFWEREDLTRPTLNFNGALRFGQVVFEGDGEFAEELGLNASRYQFERNYARLVYDQPEEFRRWFLGDLDPETRGQQTFVQIGGIGVLRQRRRFNDFRSAVLQANRQLVLQRESTVRFLRNGVLYRELRLDPGSYDFSSLPLLTGSNDIQIEVRDSSGFVQNLNYQSYLDPIDLDPGDYEYAAYIGPTSRTFGRSPDYDGPVAFSGFFRKAFFNRPAIGVGLQASRQVQTLTGQTQFVLRNGGRILVDGGLSHSRDVGEGFSAGVAYDHLIDRGGLIDTFTIRADYLSRNFASLGNPEALNSTSWSLSSQYTRSISYNLTLLLNASYIRGRDTVGNSYRMGAQLNYRISPEWSLRGGIDYTKYPTAFADTNGLGFSVAVVFQPGYRRRAEARYQSSTDTAELSYVQTGLNQLGSLGFGGVVTRQDGDLTGQAFADYTANRFDASISHAAFGQGLSSFGEFNVTTARVGTSIAFADGVFGVGRRINDSFMLLYPHENLGDRSVVAGQSLASNDYIGRSGDLGAAVNNFLGSYIRQSVQYDVEDPPAGYDVGPGVVRVRPPYRSGYAYRVGTDAFVSAIGTLRLPNNQPVSLVGGRVTAIGEPVTEPVPFFTNSVGRFAIANLLPGRRYRVEVYGDPRTFEFEVPQNSDGLVNLEVVTFGRPAQESR
jgi:outer membrane usher protein